MKLNKIKTSLSLASLRKLKQDFEFFTIETKSSNKKSKNVAASKTLTKVLANNTNLSKYLDSNLLKYPLTINFFTNLENLLSHLKNNLDKKENNIVFINTDKVVFKENDIKQLSYISPPDLLRNLNSFFLPTILVLKCLQICFVLAVLFCCQLAPLSPLCLLLPHLSQCALVVAGGCLCPRHALRHQHTVPDPAG